MLFDRHAPAISRYVARRLGPDAADDLVAETFLVAFRRRGRYDAAQADARPWLYGIATRLIGQHRRDEVRLWHAIARTGVDPAAEPVADRVAAQAASRELAAALAGLSQAQRDVLLLVASGLGYEEAALALGVPRRDGLVAAGPGAPESTRGAGRAGPHPPRKGFTGMNEMKQLEDMCQAVPPPDPQRLAGVRARVLAASPRARDRPADLHGAGLGSPPGRSSRAAGRAGWRHWPPLPRSPP